MTSGRIQSTVLGMTRRPGAALVLLAAASVVQPACSSSSLEWSHVAPVGVDLSGRWVLDMEESSDPREVLRQFGPGGEAAPPDVPGVPGAPPGGGRPPGVTGGPPGGGGRRSPGAALNPEGVRHLIEVAGDPLERLTIRQTDSSFVVEGSYGSVYHLKTDRSVVKQEWEGEFTVEQRAGWIDGALAVQQHIDKAGTVTETFSLASDGLQLHIVVQLEIERAGDPIRVRLVYDRAAGQ